MYKFLKQYDLNTLAPAQKNPNKGMKGTTVKKGQILSASEMNDLRLEDRRFQGDDEYPYTPELQFSQFVDFLSSNGIIAELTNER